MDSFVLQRFISKNKIKGANRIQIIRDRYFSTIYFHALFLYGIFDKLRKSEDIEEYKSLDIEEIIEQVFSNYAYFLLYESYMFDRETIESTEDE
ncbi:hypothetical protein ACFLTE_08905 [Bacteroidota bacterium]